MTQLEKAILQVVEMVSHGGSVARSATKFVDAKTIVKATRRHKPDLRSRHVEVVLTVGTPNFSERKFINLCKKAGEPFPVKKIQFKLYPSKK